MDPRGLGPPARHVSPVTVTYSTVTAAGSQQGPVVPHPQNCSGQPHWNFPQVNLIQQQGQTTAQITSQQQWQQQKCSMGGQNRRLSQNQNEVYMPSQQPSFNPHLINFSRPAVPRLQNYGGNPYLGIPKTNFLPQQGQTTAQQASQQQRQQQQYTMNGQNGLSAPNQYEVYTPFQHHSFNQRMTIASRPALISDQNYGVQDLLGCHSGNKSQQLEETTAQPTSHHQQHLQQLQYQQQFRNEQMAPHENKAYMSYQPPHSNQELRTPLGQAVIYPQNREAQAPWGLHPFIQQKIHTTLQRALQQQQPHQHHQQHSMKGQNEQFRPHRYTAHRNDASMPFQRPNFDQFMTIPSKIKSASPPVPMGNMSTSPAAPMENVSTSPAVPMEKMSASFANPMGNIYTYPTSSTNNMTVYPVEQMGNMSPTDSIGNDQRILHDLNQSPHLDPTDDRFSQCPIMAEKRNYDDSTGENLNCILAKRPKTDVDADSLCTSVNNQDLSGDENGRLDSGNNKDPLSDLTKDQRVVLYTLFLRMDNSNEIILDDDVSMDDIDVWKTLKELENKGLVDYYGYDYYRYEIPYDRRFTIMKSYRENCLLSDIDKDFFIQVASDNSIQLYQVVYCHHGDGSRESEDIGPITAMRLIVEGHRYMFTRSVRGKVPECLIYDKKEFDMFLKFWCKARNTDPITLADQIPDEKVKNFYSAFTILSEMKNELMEIHLSKKKWSILISILMSERYSVFKSIQFEEKRKNIQQTFKALQDVKEEEKAEEDLVLLKELELYDELLTVDKENNKVYFVSEEIRHQVMGFFVLNCLASKDDYESYINLSTLDSLIEYVRPWVYKRQIT